MHTERDNIRLPNFFCAKTIHCEGCGYPQECSIISWLFSLESVVANCDCANVQELLEYCI